MQSKIKHPDGKPLDYFQGTNVLIECIESGVFEKGDIVFLLHSNLRGEPVAIVVRGNKSPILIEKEDFGTSSRFIPLPAGFTVTLTQNRVEE